jgi:SM-20-related protein
MIEDIFRKPPAHGHVANWLGPQMVARLLEFTQTQRDRFRETSVWNVAKGENEIDQTMRRSWKITELGKLQNEIEARAHAQLPEICTQLGAARFEPSKLEIEVVAHCEGAFFSEHQDRISTFPLSSRLISAVYYFHRTPKSFSGGTLRIYPIAGSKDSKAFVEIEPINDTLIFFPSWFPHEVLSVSCPSRRFEDSRFAINCWFHR